MPVGSRCPNDCNISVKQLCPRVIFKFLFSLQIKYQYFIPDMFFVGDIA